VLKKELVQVQTLMDNMTLERERESEKLKDECKKLQTEYANSEVMKLVYLTVIDISLYSAYC
jgi:early endosome antigen 1